MRSSTAAAEAFANWSDAVHFFTVDAPVHTHPGRNALCRWWQMETVLDARGHLLDSRLSHARGAFPCDGRSPAGMAPSLSAVSNPGFDFAQAQAIGFAGRRHLLARMGDGRIQRTEMGRLIAYPHALAHTHAAPLSYDYMGAATWARIPLLQIVPSHQAHSSAYYTLRSNGDIARHSSVQSTALKGEVFLTCRDAISIAVQGAHDEVLLVLEKNGDLLAYTGNACPAYVGQFIGARKLHATPKGMLYLQYPERLDAVYVMRDALSGHTGTVTQPQTVLPDLVRTWHAPCQVWHHPFEEETLSFSTATQAPEESLGVQFFAPEPELAFSL